MKFLEKVYNKKNNLFIKNEIMAQIQVEEWVLKCVDIIKDREYILQELKKSETEKGYTLEESYAYWKKYIDNL